MFSQESILFLIDPFTIKKGSSIVQLWAIVFCKCIHISSEEKVAF